MCCFLFSRIYTVLFWYVILVVMCFITFAFSALRISFVECMWFFEQFLKCS